MEWELFGIWDSPLLETLLVPSTFEIRKLSFTHTIYVWEVETTSLDLSISD